MVQGERRRDRRRTGRRADPVPVDGTSPTSARADDAGRPVEVRPAALRLARLHLRTGAYALARVELETAAGSGALDAEALLDLAEIRWRTDDLTGAGEAAAAYLAAGRESLVALAIAAEATAALGRPAEARRLARRAVEIADVSLDSAVRRDPAERGLAGRDRRVGGGAAVIRSRRSACRSPPVRSAWRSRPVPSSRPPMPMGARRVVTGPGVTGPAGERSPSSGPPAPAPRAADELAAARAALAAGDRADAAVRLSVVLRVSPSLAPAVLDIVAAEPGAEFDLIRGDALRLVGHESQARRSYAAAVSRLGSADEAEAVAAAEAAAELGAASPVDGSGPEGPAGEDAPGADRA